MITPDNTIFPNNAVVLITDRVKLLDTDLANAVFGRPLRNSDPNQCVGVFGSVWVPDQDSLEMRGFMPTQEPTLGRYIITVQSFVKDMEEERGLNTHNTLSRILRGMLYNDAPLRQSLATLSSTVGNSTERYKRSGVSQQRYFSNELQGQWLYLSILEFWLETENT